MKKIVVRAMSLLVIGGLAFVVCPAADNVNVVSDEVAAGLAGGEYVPNGVCAYSYTLPLNATFCSVGRTSSLCNADVKNMKSLYSTPCSYIGGCSGNMPLLEKFFMVTQ